MSFATVRATCAVSPAAFARGHHHHGSRAFHAQVSAVMRGGAALRRQPASTSTSTSTTGRVSCTPKIDSANLGFDPEVLKAGGYKLKKLTRLCQQHGLNSRGTQAKIEQRLLHFYKTAPGNFKPDVDIRFKLQMEFNNHARLISYALADANSTFDSMEMDNLDLDEYLVNEFDTMSFDDIDGLEGELEFESESAVGTTAGIVSTEASETMLEADIAILSPCS